MRRWAAWAGLFMSMATAFGGDPAPTGYTGRIWRMEDGLPHSRINALAQTADGYLWIGTSGGLVRFDGVRFVVFDRSNTPEFGDDSILSLFADRDGSLWAGTEGGGLLHYANRRFRAYGGRNGLTNGFVRAIHRDREGRLWAGTDRGLFRFRGSAFERLDGTPSLPYVAVSRIHQDSTGRLWMGGSTPLVVSNDQLTPANLGALRSVLELRDGTLVAATRDGVQEVNRRAMTLVPWNKLELDSPATAMAEDRAGNLWVGTPAEGLVLRAGAAVTTFRAPGDLPDNTVLCLFEDREENIWAGTQDGLVRFSRKLVATVGAREGLSDDDVWMVYEDRGGTQWMATGTGDLYRRVNGSSRKFEFPRSLGEVEVRTMFQDSRGAYWFGTARQGVIRWANGKIARYTTENGLRQNSIRGFHEDSRGNVWIGTGSGINRWDGARLHGYYTDDGLAYGSVRALAGSAEGDVWVGTDGGLSLIRNGVFVKEPVLAQVGSERIWAIHRDATGALWLGTRGRGLFRIRNGALVNITARDGLPGNNIYQIVEDGAGRLWMSSPAGVFSAARADLEAFAERRQASFAVVHYGTAEGLGSSQMRGGAQPSGYLAATGEIWFASVKGAVRIDPARTRITTAPPVLVEELIADERPVPLGGGVILEPGGGKIEIHYSAPALRAPERISFRYKLEGFDGNWTAASARRAAYYTGLPPGRYRFRVIAHDSAAPAKSSEASLAFEWKPHFHQTGWFYAVCGAGALAAGGFVFLLYARQTRARYALLLAERTRLAREMHDSVIQNCVGISTLLEAAASTLPGPRPSPAVDLLDRARAHVKLTLDEARQSVWDLRHASLGSGLVSGLSEYAAQLSRERNIAIQTEISGTPVDLDEKTDRNLLLVAREAVRNAIAHAGAKQVSIRVSFQPQVVLLEVKDDGRGFQPPAELSPDTGYYGLVGMRERIEELGGRFRLLSRPGEGTRVIADLPLARGHRF